MKTQLNRRHILRGTGALIALPALESIGFRRFASAAEAAPAAPSKRCVFLSIGFGVTIETWFSPSDYQFLSEPDVLLTTPETVVTHCMLNDDLVGHPWFLLKSVV